MNQSHITIHQSFGSLEVIGVTSVKFQTKTENLAVVGNLDSLIADEHIISFRVFKILKIAFSSWIGWNLGTSSE